MGTKTDSTETESCTGLEQHEGVERMTISFWDGLSLQISKVKNVYFTSKSKENSFASLILRFK